MQIVFNGADGTDVTVDHVEVLGSSVFEGGTILFMKNDTKVKIKEPPRQVAEIVNECFGIKNKREVKFGPTHLQYQDITIRNCSDKAMVISDTGEVLKERG